MLESASPTVLISPREDPDSTRLREIFSCAEWPLHTVPTLGRARDWMNRRSPALILCNSHLPDGSWRDLIVDLNRLTNPPRLIVFSRLADCDLWAEVLNLGGYDLLMSPVDPGEVRRIVPRAWASYDQDVTSSAPRRMPAMPATGPRERHYAHRVAAAPK